VRNFGELLYARTLAEKGIWNRTSPALVGELRPADLMVCEAALKKYIKSGKVNRLGQELIGAQLDGFHGALN
jgi:hypothetical protein